MGAGPGGAPSTTSVGGSATTGGGGHGGELPHEAEAWVGLEANPVHLGSGDVTPADVLLAELTTYAAGVRAVSLDVHWSELETEVGLDALAKRVADLRARGLEVVLVADVVDRRVDNRPARFDGKAWDDPEMLAAIDLTLDAVFARVGNDVTALVLGRDANVYQATFPDAAAPLLQFLTSAVTHATIARPAAPVVAVGLAFAPTPLEKLALATASLGTASAFRYAPGLGSPAVAKATSAAKDLDAMLAIAGTRPLLMTGVRFTSAATLGATAVSQAQLFEGFFAALEPRVSSVRFVNVTRLHDWTPLECARFAEVQKLTVDDPEVLFECASGLRDGADGAKLSWQAFLKASAAYAPP